MTDDTLRVELMDIVARTGVNDGKSRLKIPKAVLHIQFLDDREVPVPDLNDCAWYMVPQDPIVTIQEVPAGSAVIEPYAEPYMRPFHQPVPGMGDLFHTYCPRHLNWGTCTGKADAYRAIADHLEAEHDG